MRDFFILGQIKSLPVWATLILASLIWLFGFFWIDFKSECLEAFVTFSTLASVTYLYRLARDLNNLQTGDFKMNFASFKLNTFGTSLANEKGKTQGEHDD